MESSAGDFDGKYILTAENKMCCETMPATVSGTGTANVTFIAEPVTCLFCCSASMLGSSGRTANLVKDESAEGQKWAEAGTDSLASFLERKADGKLIFGGVVHGEAGPEVKQWTMRRA